MLHGLLVALAFFIRRRDSISQQSLAFVKPLLNLSISLKKRKKIQHNFMYLTSKFVLRIQVTQPGRAEMCYDKKEYSRWKGNSKNCGVCILRTVASLSRHSPVFRVPIVVFIFIRVIFLSSTINCPFRWHTNNCCQYLLRCHYLLRVLTISFGAFHARNINCVCMIFLFI